MKKEHYPADFSNPSVSDKSFLVQVRYFNDVREQERSRTDLGVFQQLQLFIIVSFQIRIYNVPESIFCMSTNLTSNLTKHPSVYEPEEIRGMPYQPFFFFVSRNKQFLFNSQALHNCLVYIALQVILVHP